MYTLAICGSSHRRGNTDLLLKTVLEPMKEKGRETDVLSLAGKNIHGCIACGQCLKMKDIRCVIKSDCLNEEILPRMFRTDVILVGGLTYFAGINADTKAVIDRGGFIALANGGVLAGKIGTAVVAARCGDPVHVFDTINHFFLVSQMIVTGSL